MTNFDHFLSIPQFAFFAKVAEHSGVEWGRSAAADRVGNAEEELDAGVLWVKLLPAAAAATSLKEGGKGGSLFEGAVAKRLRE